MFYKRKRAHVRQKAAGLILLLCVFALAFVVSTVGSHRSKAHDNKILVTYAYGERLGNGGEIDEHNLRFFITVGLSGITPGTEDPAGRVNYIFVVNGARCTPCRDTLPSVMDQSKRRNWVTVLYRENFGMDFGAYNTSIEWAKKNRKLQKYKYFVFINSSLRGPFMPKWTPPGFHFTQALIQMFENNKKVKLAGSYISCLPSGELFPGPILESLFFAVDRTSLSWLVEDGVFLPEQKKSMTALFEEYALMRSITQRGGFVEGLSSRYAKGIDWRNERHHSCNDNRHSSRRASLEGNISPNIFEHIFLKTSWCVRASETAVISKWLLRLSAGRAGTEGRFDRTGYLRGISTEHTSGKKGTMPLEVPNDRCQTGDLRGLRVPAFTDWS